MDNDRRWPLLGVVVVSGLALYGLVALIVRYWPK